MKLGMNQQTNNFNKFLGDWKWTGMAWGMKQTGKP